MFFFSSFSLWVGLVRVYDDVKWIFAKLKVYVVICFLFCVFFFWWWLGESECMYTSLEQYLSGLQNGRYGIWRVSKNIRTITKLHINKDDCTILLVRHSVCFKFNVLYFLHQVHLLCSIEMTYNYLDWYNQMKSPQQKLNCLGEW